MITFKRKQLIGALVVGLMYWFGTGNFVGCLIPTLIIFILISWEIKPNAS
jgi:hypothetical protein